MGVQGTSGDTKGFAATGMALRRRCELVEVGRWRRKKQRKEKERRRQRSGLYSAAKKQGDDTQQPARASAKPEKATGMPGSQRKLAGGDSCPLALFQLITELPLILNA